MNSSFKTSDRDLKNDDIKNMSPTYVLTHNFVTGNKASSGYDFIEKMAGQFSQQEFAGPHKEYPPFMYITLIEVPN